MEAYLFSYNRCVNLCFVTQENSKNKMTNKPKDKSKSKVTYNNPVPNPTYFSGNYEDYMLLDKDTQDKIAERDGFTDSGEYSDYLWAMDKED